MTNKETITRNIGLTFDFVNYIIDNPSLIEKFSDRFKLDQKIILVRNSFEIAE